MIRDPKPYDKAQGMSEMYCTGDSTVINVQMAPWKL